MNHGPLYHQRDSGREVVWPITNPLIEGSPIRDHGHPCPAAPDREKIEIA
jgi:hypothetical protein